MHYIPTIGLEVHVQLKTKSKIFCTCANAYGKEQNTDVCPVCLGLPGVLPVVNKTAIELAYTTAIALNCTVYPVSIFARKNYFYPDLPKGYQISQFEEPLSKNGNLDIPVNGSWKKIGITRIHLEEDAGKSVHPEGRESVNESRIDINRCGIPLIEIVSEPEIDSPAEAFEYLKRLKQTLLYIGVSDCNMEEGSLRCDANVSVRPENKVELGVKTELKNLNSFRYVEKALEYEIERQIAVLTNGKTIQQQTLAWDAAADTIVLMRSKEGSDDYRYFSEPDLIPVIVDEDWLNTIKNGMPEMPRAKKERFVKQFGIPEKNAEVLTSTRELADYFEEAAKNAREYKKLSNWILSEVLMVLNKKKITIKDFSVPPKDVAGLLDLIERSTISGKIAKEVFQEMVDTGNHPNDIIKKNCLEQISDTASLDKVIDDVLNGHNKETTEYLNGKEKLFGFFIGQIMKNTQGKANPGVVNAMLRDKLSSLRS